MLAWLRRLVATLLLLGLSPLTSVRAEAELCFPDACIGGRFLRFWQANGGLAIFGYPVRAAGYETINDQRVLTQYFERARFELHPENQPPYDVLLGRLGVERLAQQGRDWTMFPPATPDADCDYFANTGHTLCGTFRTFWHSHGLAGDDAAFAESLALFGAPLSAPTIETNAAGESVRSQWFERARFEEHRQGIVLGLLGSELQAALSACAATPAAIAGEVHPTACGRAGTIFTMNVYGFAPKEQVHFWQTDPQGLPHSTAQQFTADAHGRIDGIVFDTTDRAPGLWQWTFQGMISQQRAIIAITLLDRFANPRPRPRCSVALPPASNGTISQSCIRGSTLVHITGVGFQPDEPIGGYITAPDQSVYDLQPILEQPLRADEDGAFSLRLVIDGAALASGVYALTFEGSTSQAKTIVYFVGADS